MCICPITRVKGRWGAHAMALQGQLTPCQWVPLALGPLCEVHLTSRSQLKPVSNSWTPRERMGAADVGDIGLFL